MNKKTCILIWALVAIISMVSFQGQAQDTLRVENSFWEPWSGSMKFGFSNNDGNVNKQNFKFAYEFKHKTDHNQFIVDGELINNQKDGEVYQKSYDFSVLDIISLGDKSGLYIKASYYSNPFKGYDSQWKGGVGYLYNILEGSSNLTARLGYQSRFSETTNADDYNNGLKHFMLTGFMGNIAISDDISLKTKFDYEMDLENTRSFLTNASAGLNMKVNKWIAVELAYKYEYASRPVEGTKSFDTTLDLTLGVKF